MVYDVELTETQYDTLMILLSDPQNGFKAPLVERRGYVMSISTKQKHALHGLYKKLKALEIK